MFSLFFKVVPQVGCQLALLQVVRILFAPEKTVEKQLLVSVSALRVVLSARDAYNDQIYF